MDGFARSKILVRTSAVFLVLILAGITHWKAVETLPVDVDEDDYLRAAQQYTALIRSGDWAGFTQTNYRTEHPPLAKIAFGLSVLTAPVEPLIPDTPSLPKPAKNLPLDLLYPARTETAVFGSLEAGILALLDPLAGLFLALHTMTIRFTSEVMLDGLASLLSLSAVLAYVAYRRDRQSNSKRSKIWLASSAALLGLASDTKYLHALVGVAILLDWFLIYKKEGKLKTFFWQAGLWGLLAIAVFFAADPYLWPDPLGRLQESYHSVALTATNRIVAKTAYPVWQPFVWLLTPASTWNPDSFFLPLDIPIFLLAMIGVRHLWNRERVFVLWLLIALAALLAWPSKWPQYILVLTAPLSLSASAGLGVLYHLLPHLPKKSSAPPDEPLG